LLDLVALGRCLDERCDQSLDIKACPERLLSHAMLLGMVKLAQTYRAPIIRLLPDACAAPHADVRDLDRSAATAVEAAFMRPHEVAVRL
jgi:hypothetical protein